MEQSEQQAKVAGTLTRAPSVIASDTQAEAIMLTHEIGAGAGSLNANAAASAEQKGREMRQAIKDGKS